MAATQSSRAGGGAGLGLRRGNDLAFATLVGATCLSLLGGWLGTFSPLRIAGLLAVGLVYVVVGTRGFARAGRPGRPRAAPTYFAVQLALGLLLVALIGPAGPQVILLLPLAGQAVLLLPPRGVLLVGAAIVAAPTALSAPPVAGRLQPRVGVGWADAAGTASILVGVVVFAVVLAQVAVTAERARAAEARARAEGERLATALDAANHQLRAYAAQAEEWATTQERNRLAREIHDGLGHYLTAVHVQLGAALAVLDRDRGAAVAALHAARALTQEGLADVRRSVGALRAAPPAERPLPEALAALAAAARTADLTVHFVVAGEPQALPAPAEGALYRAAQEGLTNVRKHAQATRADLLLDYRDRSAVRLVVRDDGVGMGPDEDRGYGLRGVRERAGLLGGTVRARPEPGGGFTLEVGVPR